jgi:hypothetical protein
MTNHYVDVGRPSWMVWKTAALVLAVDFIILISAGVAFSG